MTLTLVIIAAAIVVALVVLVVAVWRLAPARPARGQVVTVHTKLPDDQTIRGVLVHEYRDRLILQDAEYIDEEHGAVPIAGAVRVPTAGVSWIQEHAAK